LPTGSSPRHRQALCRCSRRIMLAKRAAAKHHAPFPTDSSFNVTDTFCQALNDAPVEPKCTAVSLTCKSDANRPDQTANTGRENCSSRPLVKCTRFETGFGCVTTTERGWTALTTFGVWNAQDAAGTVTYPVSSDLRIRLRLNPVALRNLLSHATTRAFLFRFLGQPPAMVRYPRSRRGVASPRGDVD
jgi:hypothetical protein